MLDLTKLNDGDIVVIPRDITNPKPDRRQRYDWRARVTIPAGTKLRVRVMTTNNAINPLDDEVIEWMRAKGGRVTDNGGVVWGYRLEPIKGYSHQDLVFNAADQVLLDREYVSPADKLAAAVLEVAVPDKLANLGDVLGAARCLRCADALLAVLIDQGKLNLGDVQGAIDAYRADDEPYESFKARHGV